MLYQAAFRLAGWQVVVVVLVATGAMWIGGPDSGWSAVTGGSIGIIAGLYQALRMFSFDLAADPDGFMPSVYVTEALKIVLTVVLIIAAIRLLHVELLAFMVGYIATYPIYWVALRTGFPWTNDSINAPINTPINDRALQTRQKIGLRSGPV
jgi:F0F1-type ATP synthase assembly protein I